MSAYTANPAQQSFVGREAELQSGEAAIAKESSESLLYTGLRRVGKTSILLKLEESGDESTLRIYMDTVLWKVGQAPARICEEVALQLGLEPPGEVSHDAGLRWLKATLADAPKLVFLLDELFPYGEPRDLDLELLAFLNELRLKARVCVIMAAFSTVETILSPKRGLRHLRTTTVEPIGTLSTKATRELALLSSHERGGLLRWTESGLDAFVAQSGGLAIAAQILGSTLEAEARLQGAELAVDAAVVESMAARASDKVEGGLMHLWDGLRGHAESRALLVALAFTKGPITPDAALRAAYAGPSCPAALPAPDGGPKIGVLVELSERMRKEAPKRLQALRVVRTSPSGLSSVSPMLGIYLRRQIDDAAEELQRCSVQAERLYQRASSLPQLASVLDANPNHPARQEAMRLLFESGLAVAADAIGRRPCAYETENAVCQAWRRLERACLQTDSEQKFQALEALQRDPIVGDRARSVLLEARSKRWSADGTGVDAAYQSALAAANTNKAPLRELLTALADLLPTRPDLLLALYTAQTQKHLILRHQALFALVSALVFLLVSVVGWWSAQNALNERPKTFGEYQAEQICGDAVDWLARSMGLSAPPAGDERALWVEEVCNATNYPMNPSGFPTEMQIDQFMWRFAAGQPGWDHALKVLRFTPDRSDPAPIRFASGFTTNETDTAPRTACYATNGAVSRPACEQFEVGVFSFISCGSEEWREAVYSDALPEAIYCVSLYSDEYRSDDEGPDPVGSFRLSRAPWWTTDYRVFQAVPRGKPPPVAASALTLARPTQGVESGSEYLRTFRPDFDSIEPLLLLDAPPIDLKGVLRAGSVEELIGESAAYNALHDDSVPFDWYELEIFPEEAVQSTNLVDRTLFIVTYYGDTPYIPLDPSRPDLKVFGERKFQAHFAALADAVEAAGTGALPGRGCASELTDAGLAGEPIIQSSGQASAVERACWQTLDPFSPLTPEENALAESILGGPAETLRSTPGQIHTAREQTTRLLGRDYDGVRAPLLYMGVELHEPTANMEGLFLASAARARPLKRYDLFERPWWKRAQASTERCGRTRPYLDFSEQIRLVSTWYCKVDLDHPAVKSAVLAVDVHWNQSDATAWWFHSQRLQTTSADELFPTTIPNE